MKRKVLLSSAEQQQKAVEYLHLARIFVFFGSTALIALLAKINRQYNPLGILNKKKRTSEKSPTRSKKRKI